MHAAAYFVATQKMTELLKQSADERLISMSHPKPTLRARIASATAGLRRAFGEPIDLNGPALPTLENYPYRG